MEAKGGPRGEGYVTTVSQRLPLKPAATVTAREVFADATSALRTSDYGITGFICNELALDIVEGRLSPGQELNSVDLAARFEASRTPVREALLRLESEGLVSSRPRHRTEVFKPTLEQVRDIYQLRAHLHLLVSELVVESATNEQISELEAWQEVCAADVANQDGNAYFWHNIAARNAELHFAGNQELERMLRSLGLRTLQLRHLSLSLPGRSRASSARHGKLVAAYRHRDLETAKRVTVELIETGFVAIEKWITEQEKGDAGG